MSRMAMHIGLAVFLVVLSTVFGLFLMRIISPSSATPWQFAEVYLLVFFWVYGLTALLGYFFRVLFWRNGIRYEFLKSARRQAALLGFLAVAALILQASAILNLKTGALLLAIFLLLELYVQ